MAVEILHTGGFADGERTLNTGVATAYVGGQPAKITASGAELAVGTSNTEASKVIGIFKNARTLDTSGGVQLNDAVIATTDAPVNATLLTGDHQLRMFTRTGDAAPFVWPGTAGGGWAVDNELFVNTTGFWDNAPQNVGDKAHGRVVKAPTSATDDLIADMYGVQQKV